MARIAKFTHPQAYLDVLVEFQESGLRGVKFEKASREDAAVLKMAIFCNDLPFDAVVKNGEVYLIRIDNEA